MPREGLAGSAAGNGRRKARLVNNDAITQARSRAKLVAAGEEVGKPSAPKGPSGEFGEIAAMPPQQPSEVVDISDDETDIDDFFRDNFGDFDADDAKQKDGPKRVVQNDAKSVNTGKPQERKPASADAMQRQQGGAASQAAANLNDGVRQRQDADGKKASSDVKSATTPPMAVPVDDGKPQRKRETVSERRARLKQEASKMSTSQNANADTASSAKVIAAPPVKMAIPVDGNASNGKTKADVNPSQNSVSNNASTSAAAKRAERRNRRAKATDGNGAEAEKKNDDVIVAAPAAPSVQGDTKQQTNAKQSGAANTSTKQAGNQQAVKNDDVIVVPPSGASGAANVKANASTPTPQHTRQTLSADINASNQQRQQQKVETERRRKADEERKRQEKERQRKLEEQRRQQEIQRQQETERRRQEEQQAREEQRRADLENQRRAENERRQREDAERRRRQQEEELLRQEEQKRAEAEAAARVMAQRQRQNQPNDDFAEDFSPFDDDFADDTDASRNGSVSTGTRSIGGTQQRPNARRSSNGLAASGGLAGDGFNAFDGRRRRQQRTQDPMAAMPTNHAVVEEMPVEESELREMRRNRRKRQHEASKSDFMAIVRDTIAHIRTRSFQANMVALGNWMARHKVALFLTVAVISLLIGMMWNRYVSVVLAIAMVGCGAWSEKVNDDNDMFFVYMLAFGVFAFPFLF